MSVLPREAVHNSAILQAVTSVRARVRTAAADARVMTVLNRGRATNTREPEAESPPNAGNTDTEPTTPQQPAARDTAATPPPRSRSKESSVAYRVLQRGQGFVTSAWLYEWLTAEPEPEVIVIDLRKTRTVGVVLSTLDRVLTRAARDLLPALPTATVTRGGYWLRGRFVDRPLRVVSIGLAIITNLGLFSILTGSDDPITPVTLLLLAALLLAARGFQSTTSLEELTNTAWYQRTTAVLKTAFEPPDPPELASSEEDTTESATTETTSDPARTDRV